MKRLIVDVSSVLWMSLLAGKDQEFGKEVDFNGKKVWINGWQFGVECALNHLTSVMKDLDIVPTEMIFVVEGKMSKARRQAIYSGYKVSRDRPQEAYPEFNRAKDELTTAFRNVGAQIVTQDGVEADDVIAYLVRNLDGTKIIRTNDGDMTTLLTDPSVFLYNSKGLTQENKYGPFPHKYVPVYKALVGDGDEYKGAAGFGPKSFLDFLVWAGDQGLAAIEGMILRKTLHELEEDVAEFKPMRKIVDGAAHVYESYECALLHDEWCNTLRQPLVWQAGMVRGRDVVTDERLRPFAQSVRLITAENYKDACNFLKSRLAESAFFCLDLETTVPEESDDWLAQRTAKGGGVDVVASTIVGCGITFGRNQQYGFYCSVDHADTNNITLDQLREMLELFPKDKLTVAQNAAGFELPVLFNAFGGKWKGNGWRGFFPNMVDSRIAASYWNENAPSHGLKQLSKALLGYDQTSYEQVTTKEGVVGTLSGGTVTKSWSVPVMVKGTQSILNPETEQWEDVEVEVQAVDEFQEPVETYMERRTYKMDGLTAAETIAYGLDDVFTTVGIWNFFKTVMEIEKSYDAFINVEQKPMYLSALSFVQGTPISLERLFKLKAADEARYAEDEKVLHAYLIEKGWSGTQCPVLDELTPALIKEAVQIILGQPLETSVRTISKLAKLVELLDHEDAPLLAQYIAENNLQQINDWMAKRFDGTPNLNVGSNKQLVTLLYETMGLPIRLRNKATDVMRAKGIREGNPRADDDAMAMAIKMGDASPEVAPVLEALTSMKSINTKMGLYWNAYPGMCHWKDRRLHPELRQCATNTRRHTGSSPNIQQMDATGGGVRSVIVPHHKEAVIVSCDLAGQEIRLLADMSRDENMMSAYMGDNLKDLHSFTAAMILDIPYEEFRARYKSEDPAISGPANEARQNGKITFFASSYGAMAPKIAEGLGTTEEISQSYLDALDRAFPRVNEWKKETEDFASRYGWVPIHGGAPRHLRELILSEDRWMAQKALRQASNARIQGAGGYQLRTIMSKVWDSDLIDAYDFQWYWPVHDECVFSVGRGDAVKAIQKFHGILCEQFLDVLPSASSIGIGKTFGNLVEIGEVPDEVLIDKAVCQVLEECAVLPVTA